MLDIVKIEDGLDLGIADTAVMKAGNVLSIQLGSLEYAPGFGVDLRYFLQDSIQFQNESFKAYLVQRLTEHQVNVSEVIEVLDSLTSKYVFSVGDANQNAKGLIV
jgi:hypothetical protein